MAGRHGNRLLSLVFRSGDSATWDGTVLRDDASRHRSQGGAAVHGVPIAAARQPWARVIVEVLGTLGVGFISAFLPVVPAEPYLVGIVATTTTNPALLGIATALGQSVGKLTMFLTARGTLRSPVLRQWLVRQRARVVRRNASADQHPGPLRRTANWLVKVGSTDRHRLAGAMLLFVSAFIGIPPLIMMTFTAAASGMRTTAFVTACLLGRTGRMLVVALLPSFAGLSFHV